MDLIDTNVFLEILLGQRKQEDCRRVLQGDSGTKFLSDFTLHSIGVILFRHGKEDAFQEFVEDILVNFELLRIPRNLYSGLSELRAKWKLDFDDAYQVAVAKH